MALCAECPVSVVGSGIDLKELRIVIKCRGRPRGSGMTLICIARLRIPRRVLRVRGALVVRLMALVTIRINKLIVAVRVAILTLDGKMSARQRQLRRGMIERRRSPAAHRVACRARRGEEAAHMIRIGGAVEVGLMTVDTILVKSGKDIIDVTTCARNCLVCPGKRKCRIGVIKRRGGPDVRRVALVACVSKISRCMIRIACVLVVRLVACVTVRV